MLCRKKTGCCNIKENKKGGHNLDQLDKQGLIEKAKF